MGNLIAIVAPSCPLDPALVPLIQARAEAAGAQLMVHPQCFASDGHFAGTDAERLEALLEVMADERIGAIWFARGGYGSNRIAEAALADLPEAARVKTFMGYSDAGFLLAGLYKAGLDAVHGPMPGDAVREGGAEALDRALAWLTDRSEAVLEPGLDPSMPALAFNLTVLSNLMGTSLEPDFDGVDLLLEDVAEYEYRIDRAMFHLTAQPAIRNVARIRQGRFTDTPENDRPFGRDIDAIMREWCERSGLTFGGTADIGHDTANRVVPFGRRR